MNAKLKPLCGGKFVIHRRDTQIVGILVYGSSVMWPCVCLCVLGNRNHFMLENLWFSSAFMCVF